MVVVVGRVVVEVVEVVVVDSVVVVVVVDVVLVLLLTSSSSLSSLSGTTSGTCAWGVAGVVTVPSVEVSEFDTTGWSATFAVTPVAIARSRPIRIIAAVTILRFIRGIFKSKSGTKLRRPSSQVAAGTRTVHTGRGGDKFRVYS